MLKNKFLKATLIQPSFPNWEKSFVSGPNSTLFEVEHRLTTEPTELITKTKFKTHAEGPPGHIHGGATAAIIDEVMGILVWNQNYPCVTQQLNLKYIKPIPINMETYIVTTIGAVSEKSIEVKSIILNQENTVYVQASGVFHRLTQKQLDDFKAKSIIEQKQ